MLTRARDLPCNGHRRERSDFCSTGASTGCTGSRVLHCTDVRPVGRSVRVRLVCFRVQKSLLAFRDSANLLMCNEHPVSSLLPAYTVQLHLWAPIRAQRAGEEHLVSPRQVLPYRRRFPTVQIPLHTLHTLATLGTEDGRVCAPESDRGSLQGQLL